MFFNRYGNERMDYYTTDEVAAAHNAFPTFGEGLKYAAQRVPAAAWEAAR